MNVHVLQHDPSEGPGLIADWALARGHGLTVTHLHRGESLPAAGSVDCLLVMGGPMNVYQDRDFPWLNDERNFIKAHVDAGKSAIGICLGSQLLADALGGRVTQNPEIEIGWFPVDFVPEARDRFSFLPRSLEVLHWHGDTFALPPGAQRLATSAACSNQGFLFEERVLALQFHPEMTRQIAAELLKDNSLPIAAFCQTGAEIVARSDATFAAPNALLVALLDAIFAPR